MKTIFIGDIVGEAGCRMLIKTLPNLKKRYSADMVVVNGENSAPKNGISVETAELIFAAGADVITGGNHSLRRREILPYMQSHEYLLRPANLPATTPGNGMCLVDKGSFVAAVISILGRLYIQNTAAPPFSMIKEEVQKAKDMGADFVFVDFHAEATSEKKSMGFFLDGLVSGVVGTHTHIQTSDAQILPRGTGYITDLGMTGGKISVLGAEPQSSIAILTGVQNAHLITADGECILDGCVMDCNKKTGLCESIEYFEIEG